MWRRVLKAKSKDQEKEKEEELQGLDKVLKNQNTRIFMGQVALQFLNDLSKIMTPVPPIGITEFCENNLILPREVTNEHGYYSCKKTPYLREVMNCMHPNDPCNKVVFWSGTQLGKTQGLFNIMFYYMKNDPCGILFGFSNDGEKKKMVSSRLDPIMNANKWISDLIVSSNNGKSGNTLHMKNFKGGFMTIASAQSPASFRSMPTRLVCLDEIDAYPTDANGEGDIVSLAAKRTSTFGDTYKIYLSSTTTNKMSKIMAEYENTDKRKYYVPCPHCGKMQLIDWERFSWSVEGTKVTDVYMKCKECGYHIHNEDKVTMLPQGKWIATNDTPTAANAVGFWLSGLYAPLGWQSWEKCVTEYIEAISSRNDAKLSSFYNCILAMPYETDKDVPKKERLYNESKASNYTRGEVKDEVVFLTSGSDVQKDRIETEVVGWTRLGRCVSIDVFKFYCNEGTTTRDIESQCWVDYQNEILDGVWAKRNGSQIRIVINGLDRSYNTPTVNAFWAQYNQPQRFVLVRGDINSKDRVSAMKEYKPGKKVDYHKKRKKALNNDFVETGKYRYINVGVAILKSEIYALLRLEDNPQHTIRNINEFPNDYDEEYFAQLTSEIPTVNPNTDKVIWKKMRDRNEILDMHVYNYAMWYYIEAQKLTDKDFDALEAKFTKARNVVNATTKRVKKTGRRILNSGLNL